MSRFTLALSLAVLAVTVSAQSVPDPNAIPSACSSQCTTTYVPVPSLTCS